MSAFDTAFGRVSISSSRRANALGEMARVSLRRITSRVSESKMQSPKASLIAPLLLITTDGILLRLFRFSDGSLIEIQIVCVGDAGVHRSRVVRTSSRPKSQKEDRHEQAEEPNGTHLRRASRLDR